MSQMLSDLQEDLNYNVTQFNSMLQVNKDMELTRPETIQDVYERLQHAMDMQYLASYIISILICIKDELAMMRDRERHMAVSCNKKLEEVRSLLDYYKEFCITFSSRIKTRNNELDLWSRHVIGDVDTTGRRQNE